MPPEASTSRGDTAVLDPDSAEWVRTLGAPGRDQQPAVNRLHALLLRTARNELSRRTAAMSISRADRDDLAHQAAADAMLAITAKLGTFRGESRFTTWAYRFVILEVSAKIGRHLVHRSAIPLDTEDWDHLPDRFGLEPARETEWRDLMAALRRAVNGELTERQRKIFVAVVNGVSLDALVVEYGTNRNAIYKTMFDVRRKLRAALIAEGYLDNLDSSGG
jgi:RNA polymerase sigma-70 factor, ECF subfamily